MAVFKAQSLSHAFQAFRRDRLWLCASLVALAAIGELCCPARAAVPDPRAPDLPLTLANDTACGVRCVDCVLRYFDKRADFVDLLQEVQVGELYRPASLADLRAALLARGVAVAAVRLQPRDFGRLSWSEPVIIHLAAGENAVGHFVVALPCDASPGSLRVWDGLLGFLDVPLGDVSSRASGVVLLTSARAISNAPECLRAKSSSLARAVCVAAVVAVSCFVVIVSIKRRKE